VKPLDRWLQSWRIRMAEPHVPARARLLDVGCADGVLLDRLAPRVSHAVGVDPEVAPSARPGREIRRDTFPGAARFPDASFDCVTLLAVLEHVPDPHALARECHRILAPGGRAILTVPHPIVDRILDVLMAMRILDGMETEEHHGFDVAATAPIFEAAGFRTIVDRRFQLGLNRLFVFERASLRDGAPALDAHGRLE
jgi:2-polyprenyl-3-methyl-5-hydroxy-6-metoxy-1,4-benzoquinol methylase